MIRQYRIFMARVFMALLYIRHRSGVSLKDIMNYTTGLAGSGGRNKILKCNEQLLRSEPGLASASLDQMLEELAEQLSGSSGSSEDRASDGDLIDQLVFILGLPFIRNVLSADVIQDLRRALLIPAEMAPLVERLKTREWSCFRCQHIFVYGEMITIGGDGHEIVLICSRCQRPKLMSCDHCVRQARFSAKFVKTLGTLVDCGGHPEASSETVTPAKPDYEVEAVRFRSSRAVPHPPPASPPPVSVRQYMDLITLTDFGRPELLINENDAVQTNRENTLQRPVSQEEQQEEPEDWRPGDPDEA
jgi:hypothetical protein